MCYLLCRLVGEFVIAPVAEKLEFSRLLTLGHTLLARIFHQVATPGLSCGNSGVPPFFEHTYAARLFAFALMVSS